MQTVVFHEDDRDLDRIVISLPDAPPLDKIYNYGLAPEDQFFGFDPIPPKLNALNNQKWIDVERYWEAIVDDWEYYKDEMWFIEQEWERRRNGYWFYNAGVPTWITGRHYMYLRWFEIDNENGEPLPDYRDRDRKFFTALWYCENTQDAYFRHKITDPTGEIMYTSIQQRVDDANRLGWKVESHGYTIDMGYRTVIGMTWNKMRREGASTKAKSIELDIATSIPEASCGCQSATEEHAEKIFKKILLKGWRGYPFFFKPINENNPDPQKALRMKPQSKKGKRSGDDKIKEALYSQITYKAATENAYDGEKLYWLHNDECGKTKEVNVERRWMKFQKQTLTLGANKDILGIALCTTTVGDMEKDGGTAWKKICGNSHYRDRNDNGQTLTGLLNFFIPSDEGLSGFIDKHGNSMKKQARLYIENQIAQFIQNGDEQGLVDFKKDVPLCFRDCFSILTGNKRFPMIKVNERLNQFLFNDNESLVYGKLYYINWPSPDEHRYLPENLPKPEDIMSGKVKVGFKVTDKSDYDWEVSALLDDSMANKNYRDVRGEIHPANTAMFSQGSDTFKIGEDTTSGKGSNGAGAIFRKYNPAIDSPQFRRDEKDPETGKYYHKTGVFNAIYNKIPPTTWEYCENQLMASIFWGCKNFPEINLTDVWKWYAMRGFINYLHFRIDVRTGKELKQPGFHTGGETRNSIFNAMRDYLEMSALIENHLILLEQCRDIDLKMNDYDVFTACGFALLGANEAHRHFAEQKDIDISNIFRRRRI